MIDLTSYTEKFEKAGEPIEIIGAATNDSIEAVESMLGIKIRGQYRDFVNRYGGLRVIQATLNGIHNEPPTYVAGTLFGDTKRLRDEFGLPRNYVVIKSSEDEYFVCLDLDAEGEPTVVSVNPRKNFRRTPLNTCFDDYLREDLDAALEAID
jgi:SMI1-KNR4 cell-wall